MHTTAKSKHDQSLLLITGWAHGPEAVTPLAEALSGKFDVQVLTGAEVLMKRTIPDADCIVTGSMGGMLAMELLPESCKRLVLISSTAKFCSAENYPCGTPDRVLRRMITQLQRDPATVLDDFLRNVHYPRRESRQAIAMRKDRPFKIDELAAGLEYLLNADLREQVGDIEIPVLLLHGTEDRIIPPTASEWLHERLSTSELKIIANGGHALPAHHQQEVLASLNRFLGG